MNINVSTRTLSSVAKSKKSIRSFLRTGANRLLDNSIHLFAFRSGFGLRGESEPFLDDVERAAFHFRVNAAKVFADNAERDELNAAHEKHGDEQRRPAARQVPIEQPVDDGDDDTGDGDP